MPEISIDRYIEKASECNINQFIKCKFEKQYEVLIISGNPTQLELEIAFDYIFLEYLDLSGLTKDSTERMLTKKKLMLEGRKMVIEYLLFILDIDIKTHGKPNAKYFTAFEPHGFQLFWYDDLEDFKQQMEMIRMTQTSYNVDLLDVKKQLEEHKAGLSKNGESVIDDEAAFLRMINHMERENFKIDFEKTSVKRFALMIADYRKIINVSEIVRNKN